MAVSFETAQAQAPEDVCWPPPLVGRSRTSSFGDLDCARAKRLKAIRAGLESCPHCLGIWLDLHFACAARLTANCRWNVADPHRLKN
jgi:hypothetical protein